MKLELYHGDCLEVLRDLPSASVDAIVTDPPAGIGFMGRSWDHHKGGRSAWVAWLAEVLAEALRVAKPGAHAYVWALPRTSHWTMCAVEDAGWEVRDVISHIFGTGFPKSMSVERGVRQHLGEDGVCQCGANKRSTESTSHEHSDVDRNRMAEPSGGGGLPRQGDVRLRGTVQGSRAGCRTGRDSHDEPPRLRVVGGPTSPPSRGCAPARNRSDVNDGDRAGESSRIPSRVQRNDLHASTGSALLAGGETLRSSRKSASSTSETDGSRSRIRGNAQDRRLVDGSSWSKDSISCERCGKPIPSLLDGLGTALKPSVEQWILARKPINGTIASNVLEYGTGALNIDGCRVATSPADAEAMDRCNTPGSGRFKDKRGLVYSAIEARTAPHDTTQGRWPPHLLLSHHPECVRVGVKRVPASAKASGPTLEGAHEGRYSGGWKGTQSAPFYADEDGLETITDYRCVEGCPVRMLGEQSGESGGGNGGYDWRPSEQGATPIASNIRSGFHFGDTGTAARYFPQFHYTSKVQSSERWGYCETCGEVVAPERRKAHPRPDHVVHYHPTQKSVDLMRWLVRLILPPGGVVLDPFMGSGTTGVAASREGAGTFIGIDAERYHYLTADQRLREQTAQRSLLGDLCNERLGGGE